VLDYKSFAAEAAPDETGGKEEPRGKRIAEQALH